MEILKSMVEQKPEDGFARYGLAMEHVRGGDLESAVEAFRQLLSFNPRRPRDVSKGY
jgi:cytochrome c-type biogenesis protein CcmH/NrfG